MAMSVTKETLIVCLYNRVAFEIDSGYEGDNMRGAVLWLTAATLLTSPDFPDVVGTDKLGVGEPINTPAYGRSKRESE